LREHEVEHLALVHRGARHVGELPVAGGFQAADRGGQFVREIVLAKGQWSQRRDRQVGLQAG